ncbi:MAG TPA: hypothetical protein VJ441_00650 [Dehalococcoidia bacterium]|nr:hypothetical protein [Dehalococcoidia bacterium]
MPRGSRHSVSKSALHGKGRKSRKKRRAVSHPAPLAAKRISPSRGAPAALTPSAARAQQIVPQYPYVAGELKRIGIITGAMLLILIILSLVQR